MSRRFRQLAGVTTGLTFVLILLGVYTKATGAGLACAARWPFCDGWLGLFPANLKSFIEWSHRLVAMITGFCILGTAALAWRTGRSRRIRYAVTGAAAVLPAQILLGANTIFNYGVLAQVLHHTAALLIFAGMVAATAWAVVEPESERTVDTGAETDPGPDPDPDADTTPAAGAKTGD